MPPTAGCRPVARPRRDVTPSQPFTMFARLRRYNFDDGPMGERLFFRWGPFARPYVVQDLATENELLARWVRFQQCWAFFFVAASVAAHDKLFGPRPTDHQILIFVTFAALPGMLAEWLMLRGPLHSATRLQYRLPLRWVIKSVARRHSQTGAVLRIVVLTAICIAAYFSLFPTAPVTATITVSCCALLAAWWFGVSRHCCGDDVSPNAKA